MRTFEMLIVFGALMAIIALVAIAIDWIGKPLRSKRFLPRMYRYDDEVLPEQPRVGQSIAWVNAAPPMVTIPGTSVAPSMVPSLNSSPPLSAESLAQASTSAFSDTVFAPPETVGSGVPAVEDGSMPDDLLPPAEHHLPFGQSSTPPLPLPRSWVAGMPLDARVGDRKPTLAIKAERFWQSQAQSTTGSHFGNDDHARMAAGKAPRRRDPRTGKVETMQLVGLRQASIESSVRMRWPDDAIDPWSSR